MHQVKQKVQNGLIEITYVITEDQCADSLTKYLKGALTKYLKGGEPQKKANSQLPLIDLDLWLPGKDLVTRARKVRFSNKFDFHQPVVKRFFLFGSGCSQELWNSTLQRKRIFKNGLLPIKMVNLYHP